MRSAISGAIAIALLLAAEAASAEEPAAPPAVKARLSGYERTSLENALARVKGEVDPSPAGKIVESIAIVPFEVFEKRDFIPEVFLGFVNWFHVTSKPYVIEREVLLAPGQRYDQAFVDETARNLRNTRQVSLVLVTPVVGSAPDRVKLLVITKDIWSLRLNADYRFAGGKLEYLLVEPSEENFLGTHQSIFATFQMRQDTFSFGGRYRIPRIAGSRIQGSVSAGVILGRVSGLAEGSYGSFAYGQPLYATKATWAWEGTMSWRHETVRRFIGSKLRTFDSKTTPDDDAIPFTYGSDALSGRYSVTRSFGVQSKTDVTENIVETNTSETISTDEGTNDTVISDAELANGTENSTGLENSTN